MTSSVRVRLGFLAGALIALAACTAADEPSFDAPDAGSLGPTIPLRLLQANVGNVALGCGGYRYKLCDVATEEQLAAAIGSYHADLVVLQELTTAEQCAAMNEGDPTKVCYPGRSTTSPDQVRRLVGPDYTIACDTRFHYECVAVRREWGAISGCRDGELCIDPRVAETASAGVGCDDGFSASAVVIEPAGAAPFRLVDMHPPSGSAVDCRTDQLAKTFSGATALARGARSLVAGDFNLDPYEDTDASAILFRSEVSSSGAFHLHSGSAEHQPPYPTAVYVLGNSPGSIGNNAHTYDHVLSTFASGTCQTLGEAPGTTRLDGGTGTDHRALACDLALPTQ